MKKPKSIISMFMSLLMTVSMLPAASQTAFADSSDVIESYKLNGNLGATVTFSETVTDAYVNDSSLAEVKTDGNTITVTAKDGAVGIAGITVNGSSLVEVPVGYTTYIFDEDKVTIYNGSDDKSEVYGIKADSKDDIEMTAATDENGNTVYKNDGDTKLNVNIKKKGGTYVFSGKANDMNITVNKGATADANIILAGLDLTSSLTSPITVKKESEAAVTINALAGTENTLTDNVFNNADLYGSASDGGDGSNPEYAESAVIKCKANSNVTLTGKGTLSLNCATKNAVKSGESASLTIDSLNLNVVSEKNGISADNKMTINSGNIYVTAKDGDAVRSDPDAVSAEDGTAAVITVNGGNITLNSAEDGIQSAQDITITGGNLMITTGSGYNDSSFNKDTISCKGLKAANISDAEEPTNTITITGGTIDLNTADDAVHSDGYVLMTGGKVSIQTGDDGIHADTSLTLGTKDGDDSLCSVDVQKSYEGLEAGNVYIYSGTINILSDDDGINAAGGAASSIDNDGFNPGGDPGRPRPPRDDNELPFVPDSWHTGHGDNGGNGRADYSLNIYGGTVYVNCEGDGLDSNGTLNLEGGVITVWSQEAGRDNCPLDSDGTLYINGATVFAAGGNAMNEIRPSSESQTYVTSKTVFSKSDVINVTNADETSVIYSTTALKKVNFVIYSTPDLSNDCKIVSGQQSSEEFEVVYNMNGHGKNAMQKIKSGAAIDNPLTPTADGYDFDGWYTDEACTNKFDFTSPIVSSITLYAKWIDKQDKPDNKNTYKIGDVDNDQSIDSADSLYILRASVGLEDVDEKTKVLYDVDGDDRISSADSLDVLRYSVGLRVDSMVGNTVEL